MSTFDPQISVIIPNYNHAPFLKQRIDSVINQTFQDFELIILDDCSTDHSREIIEESRVHPKLSRIVYNPQNSGGVFKQWIKGIAMAKGKYVWIAESDDFSSENFLEETVKILQQDSKIGAVFTNSTIVGRAGSILGKTIENEGATYKSLQNQHNIINCKNVSRFLINEMVIGNVSSVLFRREVLLNINFPQLGAFFNTGDRFVYVGIALQNDIAFLNRSLNFMRIHETNTTKKSIMNGTIHRDRLKVLNYYFNEIYETDRTNNVLSSYYKKNYQHFSLYGNIQEHSEVLKKLKVRTKIHPVMHYLITNYMKRIHKTEKTSRVINSITYRILRLLTRYNDRYQK